MKNISRISIIILPIIIILPFIIISFYNHPALDDWWYAEVYKENGLTGAQQFWYNNYTARFFSNLIMTMAPLSYGWVEGYKILPVIFILCLFGSFYFASNNLLKTSLSKYVLPLWLTATYLIIQRDYFECLYWLSANVVYQFAMISFMLHLTFLAKILLHKQYSFINFLMAILFSIAVTGSNESLGGLLLVESIIVLAYCIYQKRFMPFALLFILVQAVCWLVMFLAPGNWSKINVATEEHIYTFFFGKAIGYSFISAGYYGVFLLKQPAVWCLFILSLPVWKKFFAIIKINKINYLILSAFICLCAALSIFFISIYPTGILIPPLRITNLSIIFLFSGISIALLWVVEKYFTTQLVIIKVQQFHLPLMVACVVFAFTTSPQYKQMITDMTGGKAAQYNRAMYERYEMIKKSDADTIVVPKLINVPRTIVATDVSGHVENDLGKVFNKNAVVIIK